MDFLSRTAAYSTLDDFEFLSIRAIAFLAQHDLQNYRNVLLFLWVWRLFYHRLIYSNRNVWNMVSAGREQDLARFVQNKSFLFDAGLGDAV